MNLPLYFDYMATTPVDERVITEMQRYLGRDSHYGNPASTTHCYGQKALKAVEDSRQIIADLIGASSDEIIWTSGATESDNLAIIGAMRFYQRKGRHLITMATEHKAVLDSCHALEQEGYDVTYLKPKSDGLLCLNELDDAIREDTVLASIMHVNNEIGVIQDIESISQLLKQKGVLLHVDAAQSAGKLAIDVNQIGVDLLSISGHKIYGPKGIGVLYVRRKPRIRLMPLIHGGGHENGLRSGTLATHQIVGMAKAFALAVDSMETETKRLQTLRDKLWNGINQLSHVSLNGHPTQRIVSNLNICFKGFDGDSLLLALRELAVSTTSACSSASVQPSYVLKSIGLSDNDAHSSIRLSLGRYTSEACVDKAVALVNQQIGRLQQICGVTSKQPDNCL